MVIFLSTILFDAYEIQYVVLIGERSNVTPFAGVWIEIQYVVLIGERSNVVTPFAGVWIEILA